MSIMMPFKGSIGIQNQIIALLHGSTSLLVPSLIMLATKWELDNRKMGVLTVHSSFFGRRRVPKGQLWGYSTGCIGMQNQVLNVLDGSVSIRLASLNKLATKYEPENRRMGPYNPFLHFWQYEASKMSIVGSFKWVH